MPRLARWAEGNGVAALMHGHLAAAGLDAVRPDASGTLRGACRALAANSFVPSTNPYQPLARLPNAGVAAIPWTGPSPAARAYGYLDLLVRLEDGPRARVAVPSTGYHPTCALTGPQVRAARRAGDEEQFTHGGQLVEPHLLAATGRGEFGRLVRLVRAPAGPRLDAPLWPEAAAAVGRDAAIPSFVVRMHPQFTGVDRGAGLVLPFPSGVRDWWRDRARRLARTTALDRWSLLSWPNAARPLCYLLRPLQPLGHYGPTSALGRQ